MPVGVGGASTHHTTVVCVCVVEDGFEGRLEGGCEMFFAVLGCQ